ncbi:MAG: putative toxin-antitoxin system toxin component, PIN family [Sideroxydans sp.]|nr:putative toxin-antitoxin system toxin component, PIN family [Sideroxydans sp.]
MLLKLKLPELNVALNSAKNKRLIRADGSGYECGFFGDVMARHTVSFARSVQLNSSAVLLDELAEVLTRPSASKRLSAIDKNARTVLADYRAAIKLVSPTHIPRVVLNDPDDDHVIAAALAAHADLIVSGDDDLISLKHYEGIFIINAAEAIERISR